MDEQQKDRPDGLIITDNGENYYYLRPEVLASAKMPPEEVEKIRIGLAKENPSADRKSSAEELKKAAGEAGMPVAPQLPGVPSIPQLSSIRISPTSKLGSLPGEGARVTSYSTVMCPW